MAVALAVKKMTETTSTQDERRRYTRVRALYLLSYVSRSGDEQKTPISMGRTLDVSPAGVRIEVHQPIEKGSEMEMTIGVKEDAFPVRGKVIYSTSTNGAGGMHQIGIEFDGTHPGLG